MASPTSHPGDLSRTACLARQPILDGSGRVFAYELLYRARAEDSTCTVQGDIPAADAFTNAVLDFGLKTLTNGRPAFINFTRRLLLADAATLLPADDIVIEVLEDVVPDDEVVQACQRLRDRGYRLALDDFSGGSDRRSLLPFVDFVKIDALVTSPDEVIDIAAALPPGVRMVAEKVETRERERALHAAGCCLFQGYYFCRPRTLQTGTIPASRLACLNLLVAVSRSQVTFHELADLIKRDASLSYRILRGINSAAFGLRREVSAIRDAVVLLGIDTVRRWASVWSLAGINTGPALTVTFAVVRARTCELIGRTMRGAAFGDALFLLGLCSLLDAMLQQPMADAIASMPLTPSVATALLGEPGIERSVLDATIAHERGEWDDAIEHASRAGISLDMLASCHRDAVRWVNDLTAPLAARA